MMMVKGVTVVELVSVISHNTTAFDIQRPEKQKMRS